MVSVKLLLMVGIGGAAGAILRYITGLLLESARFPYATFLVNLLGSFLIGLLFAYSIKQNQISKESWLLLATGFCGGFTTLSAFSLENFQLLMNGKYLISLMYILGSITICIGATWLGYKLFHTA